MGTCSPKKEGEKNDQNRNLIEFPAPVRDGGAVDPGGGSNAGLFLDEEELSIKLGRSLWKGSCICSG